MAVFVLIVLYNVLMHVCVGGGQGGGGERSGVTGPGLWMNASLLSVR